MALGRSNVGLGHAVLCRERVAPLPGSRIPFRLHREHYVLTFLRQILDDLVHVERVL